MHKLKHTIYLSVDELAQRLKEREVEAAGMPDGAEKLAFIEETAKLNTYLDMKRLLAPRARAGR